MQIYIYDYFIWFNFIIYVNEYVYLHSHKFEWIKLPEKDVLYFLQNLYIQLW